MFFSKNNLSNAAKVLILVFLILTTKPLEAARSLNDMKSTLGANRTPFLQDRKLVASSSPNPCTLIPKPGDGHCN